MIKNLVCGVSIWLLLLPSSGLCQAQSVDATSTAVLLPGGLDPFGLCSRELINSARGHLLSPEDVSAFNDAGIIAGIGEVSRQSSAEPGPDFAGDSEGEAVWQLENTMCIKLVLAAQVAAWNRADIDGFMRAYWQSDDLLFASGASVTSGWQETLDRYRARYDSAEKMGSLAFDILDIRPIRTPGVVLPDYGIINAETGEKVIGTGGGARSATAIVFGRWSLTRETSGNVGGLFTLVLEQHDGRWVIVRDHTS